MTFHEWWKDAGYSQYFGVDGKTIAEAAWEAARREYVVELHTADTERFFHVCEGFDGIEDDDFHETAGGIALANGREEPTRADYLQAYREVVDAAMLRQQQKHSKCENDSSEKP